MAETFAEKSSSTNYSSKFQKFQNVKEKIKLNFKSDNTEQYNKEFNLKELQKALKKCHDTAVGGDDIRYQFLKHLPLPSLDCLLSIFNHVWKTGILPDSWKEAIVIPIPKPGKDSSNPANYRPIALTSCICKTIEDFIYRHYLVLINDKSSTCLHPATGSYSSLDLTICSPGIFAVLNWKVVDDLHGSDHFPIQVSEVGPYVQQRPQLWKLNKANWEQF